MKRYHSLCWLKGYPKSWWMRYFNVKLTNTSYVGDDPIPRSTYVIVMFKQNRFTGATYVFHRHGDEFKGMYEWHEPGYGWGVWEKIERKFGIDFSFDVTLADR